MKKKTTITTEKHEVWIIRPDAESENNVVDTEVEPKGDDTPLPQLPDSITNDDDQS